MRKLIALAALGCHLAAAADPFGWLRVDGSEIQLYDVQSWCSDAGTRAAAKYPPGRRSDYVIGCWKPADGGFEATFRDGVVLRFKRSDIVPASNGRFST